MQLEIVDKFCQDGFFVVVAECYTDDGELCFLEHFRWSCSEGNERKRTPDFALVGGGVAPATLRSGMTADQMECYEYLLPEGREWELQPGPRMDDSSIWKAIIQVCQNRCEVSPTERNILNTLSRQTPNDSDGGDTLMEHFADIVGDVVIV